MPNQKLFLINSLDTSEPSKDELIKEFGPFDDQGSESSDSETFNDLKRIGSKKKESSNEAVTALND